MSRERGLPGGQERKPLHAQDRHTATNATTSGCSCQTAESARDCVWYVDQAQITLGLMVVNIHAQIVQKAEDGFLMCAPSALIAGGRHSV